MQRTTKTAHLSVLMTVGDTWSNFVLNFSEIAGTTYGWVIDRAVHHRTFFTPPLC